MYRTADMGLARAWESSRKCQALNSCGAIRGTNMVERLWNSSSLQASRTCSHPSNDHYTIPPSSQRRDRERGYAVQIASLHPPSCYHYYYAMSSINEVTLGSAAAKVQPVGTWVFSVIRTSRVAHERGADVLTRAQSPESGGCSPLSVQGSLPVEPSRGREG